jgi:hypothetical protein
MNQQLIDAAQAVIEEWNNQPHCKDDFENALKVLDETLAKAQSETPPTIVVFLSEGRIGNVVDEHGTVYTTTHTVDYDNEQNNACPVCGVSDFASDKKSEVCLECGYCEEKDNALECSLKIINEREV